MQSQVDRKRVRRRIRYRIRKKVSGTAARPRLAVYRSLKHMYVQAIDDEQGRTIAHASTQAGAGAATGGNVDAATKVGEAIAEKLKSAGISTVVLDRGGFGYHGRVQALTDAVRSAGLKV